jgi:hypothetical protein
VRSCVTCQRNKTDAIHPAGLLQPLEVPFRVWEGISLDFVEGLPKVHGKSVILTVVHRFLKYAHFIALSHPYTTPPSRLPVHSSRLLCAFMDSPAPLLVTVIRCSQVMSGAICFGSRECTSR